MKQNHRKENTSMQVFEEVIENTFLETQKIFFKEESTVVTKGSDRFLDLILEFQQGFKSLNENLAELNNLLEEATTFATDDYLRSKLPAFTSLLKSCKKVIAAFAKSDFYPGIKTQLSIYREETSTLAEFISDIELRTKAIYEDDEFQSLMSDINSL